MAIEIVHSRTATLIDNSNPDEIQADDWNDAHPITADGMGLLFSNSAGAVAETMTPDAGTLTASTPFVFQQRWGNSGELFTAFNIFVDRSGAGSGADVDSKFFSVRYKTNSEDIDILRHTQDGLDIVGNLRLFGNNFTETPAVFFDRNAFQFSFDTGPNQAFYGASSLNFVGSGQDVSYTSEGIQVNSGTFFVGNAQYALASWANIPTNTDIEDGYSAVGVDTNTGDIYLAANVGGTIFKVQLV
jgi:hypothetical protein